MITRQAATGFSGTGTLKAKAIEEATKFCSSRGKQMKVVAITEAQPPYVLGNYPKAEIVFKALGADDPELQKPSPFDTSGGQIKVGEVPIVPATNSVTGTDVYSELSKLDELRKKGILTDQEFQAEKKKILKRSK